MITPSEWVWLKSKRTYCNHCVNEERDDDCEWDTAMGRCPILSSFGQALDALEFSERVAAKLASYVGECPFEEGTYENCMKTGCVACQLRDARIEVEEDMDGYNTM